MGVVGWDAVVSFLADRVHLPCCVAIGFYRFVCAQNVVIWSCS